jgi:AcrR family transcriptional regulator
MTVDDGTQPQAEIVEAGLPRGVAQPAVDAHLRQLDPVRMVVHLRKFEDKSSLLEALVTEGFHRLGCALAAAAEPDDRKFDVVLKDVAVAYVRFAADNPALVDLMSASRYLADASEALVRARDASFAPVRRLVESGQTTGELAPGDVRRIGTLMFATLHGLATMANNRMIDPLDDDLISDAVNSLLSGLAPVTTARSTS